MAALQRIAATVATVLVAIVAIVATATPASAHATGGETTSNYLTTITRQPGLEGVTVSVVQSGDKLEIENRGAEIIVVGYNEEPYLRVGPEGVFENENSPATYLNQDRKRRTPQPAGVDPTASPRWRKVSDGDVARYHDHRAHWMGDQPPRPVRANPDDRQVVYGEGGIGPEWTVDLMREEKRATVAGRLEWVPGPSPAPWSAGAVVIGVGLAALGLVRSTRRAMASVGFAMAIIVAADVLHAFAAAWSYPGGTGSHLVKVVSSSFYAFIGWLMGGVAVYLLRKGKVDGLYAAVFSTLSIALFGGVLDVSVLSRSQAPFALPINVGRATIVLALGGIGLALACLLLIRRSPPVAADSGEETGHGETIAGLLESG